MDLHKGELGLWVSEGVQESIAGLERKKLLYIPFRTLAKSQYLIHFAASKHSNESPTLIRKIDAKMEHRGHHVACREILSNDGMDDFA